jgi:hypothetical protein
LSVCLGARAGGRGAGGLTGPCVPRPERGAVVAPPAGAPARLRRGLPGPAGQVPPSVALAAIRCSSRPSRDSDGLQLHTGEQGDRDAGTATPRREKGTSATFSGGDIGSGPLGEEEGTQGLWTQCPSKPLSLSPAFCPGKGLGVCPHTAGRWTVGLLVDETQASSRPCLRHKPCRLFSLGLQSGV